MLIKLEDKRIPLANELKPKIKTDDLLMLMVFGALWIAMSHWIINSWLG